jgi:hypothetical protein
MHTNKFMSKENCTIFCRGLTKWRIKNSYFHDLGAESKKCGLPHPVFNNIYAKWTLWEILRGKARVNISLDLERKESSKVRCFTQLHGTMWKRNVKVKIRPRAGHKGAEGEYSYRSSLSLTSAVDGGGRLTPRPGLFTSGKESRYLLYRTLGVPRAGLDRCGKSRFHRDSIPGPSSQ